MTPPRTLYFSQFKTPLGRLSVAVDAKGALAAAAFGGRDALASRLGPAFLVEDATKTAKPRRQIKDWILGKSRDFSLRLAPSGTPFQRRVWAALRKIPYGQTRSYGAIALSIGSSPRAVGRANATNPVCIVVPCHRVIGANGKLTGYAFGETLKSRLLRHEADAVRRP